MSKIRVPWKPVAFIFSIIVFWHLIVAFGIVSKALFPGPLSVFSAMLDWFSSGQFFQDFFSSIWRVVAGLVVGAGFGVFFGLLTGRIVFLDETVAPLLHILRAFPPVAIIPLVIVWFGIGDFAKVFSIAFAVFFPVWISAFIGAKAIPADYLKVAKLFSKSAKSVFVKVVVPATLPFLLNGVRIAIGVAFIMVFVSELAGASNGLGYFIAVAQITYRIDSMIAGLIVLGLLAASVDFLFVAFSKKLFPWVSENGA